MNIPLQTAEGPAFTTTTTASYPSASSNRAASASTMDQDQSSMPFGDANHGSFDPSAIDFSTNIDINTGTFVGGSFDLGLDSLAMAKGLENLGKCQNNENACLDQRCYHVISNAAAAGPSSPKRNFEQDINLEADLPLTYSMPAHKRHASVSVTFPGQGMNVTMTSFPEPAPTSTTEPMAALQSLHDSIHEGINHAPNNFMGQMDVAQPAAAALHSLHHNFHQPSNQFSSPSICQGFSQPIPQFPVYAAIPPIPDQAFCSQFSQPLGQNGGGFGQLTNGNVQPQWTNADWNALNASMSPRRFPSFPPVPVASGSSQCGVAECASNCGRSANGDCCFDPSCAAGDAILQPAASNCCSAVSCHQPCAEAAPCLQQDCPEAYRLCNDVTCMTAVTDTPISASIPTPPATESDPMGNPLATAVDGAGDTMTGLVSNDLTASIEHDEAGSVRSWQSPPHQKPSVSLMGEEDGKFTCQWMSDDGFTCSAVFSDSDQLQEHCKKAHSGKVVKPQDGYFCRWMGCARTLPFAQKSKLDRHMQTHTGCEYWILGCQIGQSRFLTSSVKPVKCEFCNTWLSAKQSLEQHIRTHNGLLPWECKMPGCTKKFKQQSALSMFWCNPPIDMLLTWLVAMHIRTHTGEKPLACEICGKCFSESSNLSKHRRTHNVRGSHVCECCGKDFHRLDQLRRHLRSAHDRQVSPAYNKVHEGRVSPAYTKMGRVGVHHPRASIA